MNNNNPHNLCTWDDTSDCTNCGIQGKLACKWDAKILVGFYAIAFPCVLITIINYFHGRAED